MHNNFAAPAILSILLASLSLVWGNPVSEAQAPCGIANTIDYPVDRGIFTLTQDYGVASPRHQGRFHTGEDWYGGRDASYGQPVYAAANGRVTYAFALGWGRDGGVVIIEHSFPDGSIAYTQYGHLAESDTITLPRRLSCVSAGDPIGVIAYSRPAPHLHFEVRVSGSDTPGPGYTTEDPYTRGWRRPAKFISNHQTWLRTIHRWHILSGTDDPLSMSGPHSDPTVLSDNSIIYLDAEGTTLRRATQDGRVLWRLRLERRAVYVGPFQGQSLIIFADGGVQTINIEGSLGEGWRVQQTFESAPFTFGDQLLFPTADGTVAALDAQRRQILWRSPALPPIRSAYIHGAGASTWIVLLSEGNEVLILSAEGALLSRMQLRHRASFGSDAEGNLLAYTQAGLWRINPDQSWNALYDSIPAGGDRSAMLVQAGRLILYDGVNVTAYDAAGALLWQAAAPSQKGQSRLSSYGDLLFLSSSGGDFHVLTQDGRVCNQGRIYGSETARQWQALGTDGTLRLAIADQILGLDWAVFTRNCAL